MELAMNCQPFMLASKSIWKRSILDQLESHHCNYEQFFELERVPIMKTRNMLKIVFKNDFLKNMF